MDHAVLNVVGTTRKETFNTFDNCIYTPDNCTQFFFIVCVLFVGIFSCPVRVDVWRSFGERFMLIAESGRVNLRRRSYEACVTIVLCLKIQKCFLKLERYLIFNRYSRSELQRSDTGCRPTPAQVYSYRGDGRASALLSIEPSFGQYFCCDARCSDELNQGLLRPWMYSVAMLVACYFYVLLFAQLMKTYSTKPLSID